MDSLPEQGCGDCSALKCEFSKIFFVNLNFKQSFADIRLWHIDPECPDHPTRKMRDTIQAFSELPFSFIDWETFLSGDCSKRLTCEVVEEGQGPTLTEEDVTRCDVNAQCKAVDGSYQCVCNHRYVLTDGICQGGYKEYKHYISSEESGLISTKFCCGSPKIVIDCPETLCSKCQF